eukprot:10816363-Alexandrium_andersonii.AAC.1
MLAVARRLRGVTTGRPQFLHRDAAGKLWVAQAGGWRGGKLLGGGGGAGGGAGANCGIQQRCSRELR